MEMLDSSVLAEGIVYGEGPRWHDGRLWFSDVHDHAVKSMDPEGNIRVEVETSHPSGLGWLPDGSLLVSTLFETELRRVSEGAVQVLVDFSDQGWSLNDMVVGPEGYAYLDLYTDRTPHAPSGAVVVVPPEGAARIVARDIATPNGLAVSADGSSLLLSETTTGKILEFSIGDDGSLTDRRVWADLGADRHPDGLCCDEEGAVWVGLFDTSEFARVRPGGEITHLVRTPGAWAVAPALGGPDRCTLYLLVNETSFEGLDNGVSRGRICWAHVDVPGAGWP